MKVADGYVLRVIHGTPYILPIGQNIALHKRGIQLNDTGAFLWNAMKQGTEVNDLLPLLAKHYSTALSELPSLEAELNTYIQELCTLGLLLKEDDSSPCDNYFRIGDIVIGYHGPDSLLQPSLLDFTCPASQVQQHWVIASPPSHQLPMGEILIRTHEIEVSQSEDCYIITYFPAGQLIKATISLDGKYAHFYCIPPYKELLTERLFHAFRFAFLLYAQRSGLFALHSSSILYREKAWLFSAASGTGKSTHAGLWHTLFQAPLMNGDLNLLSLHNSNPIVWGLPWCGTSHIYTTKSYPLGGIALLKQNSQDTIQILSKHEQPLMLMQRLVSPIWTEEMMDCNLDFSTKLTDYVPVFRALCTKEPSAVLMTKQQIDTYY